MFEAKNVNLNLYFDESLNRLKLGMNERKNFYLIFKEAINNIIKYAECENVWIDLLHQHSFVILKIKEMAMGLTQRLLTKETGYLICKSVQKF